MKDDCLQREQLKTWFDAVQGLSNPVIAAYLQALLLTGARREELAGWQWNDVDFKWRSLTIHDKVEDFRTIPLTVWEVQDTTIRLVEVTYVGTHEKAPY